MGLERKKCVVVISMTLLEYDRSSTGTARNFGCPFRKRRSAIQCEAETEVESEAERQNRFLYERRWNCPNVMQPKPIVGFQLMFQFIFYFFFILQLNHLSALSGSYFPILAFYRLLL